MHELGDFIVKNQHMRIGNSVNFGKFLKKDRDLKCMFHSLISITPSGKIKFPCYCFGDGAEYVGTFKEYVDKAESQRDHYENKKADQCKECYTHCLHEAYVYAHYYWDEIKEQASRPSCLYKKYIKPVYKNL